MQRAIRLIEKETLVWGPLFLLTTFAISARTGITLDLVFVSLTGLYLCARYQIRGFCYALALLAVGFTGRHLLFVHDHLFQLGLEVSLACSLFVTALSFEQGSHKLDALSTQVETGKNAMETLEEDMAKVQKTSIDAQIASSEKISSLNKELEELHTEHSSILMLNEVLRKTSARHTQENAALTVKLIDADRKIKRLSEEAGDARREAARATDKNGLTLENSKLLEELNAIRIEKEQAVLMNETTMRLFTRETFKAKDAEQEASQLSEQLQYARQDLAAVHVDTRSHEEIEGLQAQVEALSDTMKTANSQFQGQAKELELKLSHERETRAKLDQQIKELELKLSAEREAMHGKLANQAKAAEQLRSELERAIHKSADRELELTQKISESVEEIERLKNELNALPQAPDEDKLTRKALQAMEELERLKARLQEVEETADTTRANFEKRENDLKARLEDVQGFAERLSFSGHQEDLTQKALSAFEEVERLKKELAAERTGGHLMEQLKAANEEIATLSKTLPLFNQLKQQFEEKNQVLHKTREQLFKTDTELQKLQIEKEGLILESLPRDVEKELCRLSKQVLDLEEENRLMQELVTSLSSSQK